MTDKEIENLMQLAKHPKKFIKAIREVEADIRIDELKKLPENRQIQGWWYARAIKRRKQELAK